MAKKEDIRPIYAELQGCLSQAPPGKDKNGYSREVTDDILNHFNNLIDELNNVAKEDNNRFKLRTGGWTDSLTYRTKLGGLISRLHGQYFSDEVAPFSGMPSTVITQSQQQSQSIQVQMLLDFQSKIDAQLQKLEPGDKKRSFLEKIKESLASVKDYAGLIALYITTAQEFGISIKELLELFKY
jgi:hypothetical protein